MFAAISAIQMSSSETDSAVLLANSMCSKEGEVVSLVTAVNMAVGVKEWLGGLEKEMVVTLATLLQDAVTSMPSEESGLLKWIAKFPAQVIYNRRN